MSDPKPVVPVPVPVKVIDPEPVETMPPFMRIPGANKPWATPIALKLLAPLTVKIAPLSKMP